MIYYIQEVKETHNKEENKMTNELVKTIMAVATQEEKETFDKISRSTPEKVMDDLGLVKDEVLENFMKTWTMRAIGL